MQQPQYTVGGKVVAVEELDPLAQHGDGRVDGLKMSASVKPSGMARPVRAQLETSRIASIAPRLGTDWTPEIERAPDLSAAEPPYFHPFSVGAPRFELGTSSPQTRPDWRNHAPRHGYAKSQPLGTAPNRWAKVTAGAQLARVLARRQPQDAGLQNERSPRCLWRFDRPRANVQTTSTPNPRFWIALSREADEANADDHI